MKALFKNHLVKLLMACLSLSTFLSIFWNIRKCPYQNLCYFGEGFFLYEKFVSHPIYFIGFKVLFLIFACALIKLIDFDLKEQEPDLSEERAFVLVLFSSILGIFLNYSDFEIISLFFMFLSLISFKNIESKKSELFSFLFSLSISLLLLIDLKNFIFIVSFFIVLFLTDDILKIINLKKIFKLFPMFLLGFIPLGFLYFHNNFSDLKNFTDNFEIYSTDYLFKVITIIPLQNFKSSLLLTLLVPIFFISCGLFVLIMDEILKILNKQEDKLSTYKDLSYYISLWFVFIYLIVFSYLLKQKVGVSFFYFILLPLPYVLIKGLKEVFDKFAEEKEKIIIRSILVVLLSGVVFVSVLSYKKSLKNINKINICLNLYQWVKEIKGDYVSNGYDKIINYMLKDKKVSPFVFKGGNIGLYEMVKDYDYYISYNGIIDDKCVILIEPRLDFVLNQNIFTKYWACKGYEFTLDMEQFIFKVENLK